MARGFAQPGDQSAERIPAGAKPAFAVVAALIDDVGGRLLNEEYRQVCRRLAAPLARKRPSPLLRGQART